jgi:hypothetical protein
MAKLSKAKINEFQRKRELLRQGRPLTRQQVINRELSRKNIKPQYKIFSRQPKRDAPIFNPTTAREIGHSLNADQTDFLGKENFMLGDDFIPKEKFIARKLRDL